MKFGASEHASLEDALLSNANCADTPAARIPRTPGRAQRDRTQSVQRIGLLGSQRDHRLNLRCAASGQQTGHARDCLQEYRDSSIGDGIVGRNAEQPALDPARHAHVDTRCGRHCDALHLGAAPSWTHRPMRWCIEQPGTRVLRGFDPAWEDRRETSAVADRAAVVQQRNLRIA